MLNDGSSTDLARISCIIQAASERQQLQGTSSEQAGATHEGNIVVCEGEPRKELLEDLVDELDVQPDFPEHAVVGSVQVPELDRGVDGSEEGTVQPSPPLRDELWHRIWRVGDAVR